MEHIISRLLENFEKGKINRRQLVQNLAIAASVGSAIGESAFAAGESPLKTVGINHISYRVADYAKSRDFYSGLLGLKIMDDHGTKCRAVVGNLSLVIQPGEDDRTKKTPLIDHIAYTMDETKDGILARMKALGMNPEHGINHPPAVNAKKTEGGVQVKDPDGFHVTLVPKA
jgi:catechol 2,3-dioxygenase-like lactoylglutathione lyase family enzyme